MSTSLAWEQSPDKPVFLHVRLRLRNGCDVRIHGQPLGPRVQLWERSGGQRALQSFLRYRDNVPAIVFVLWL
jgi:hypothetical protein